MTRWTVSRARVSSLSWCRWIAESDDGEWHEFTTWQAAYDHAYHQARTVTLTIPKIELETYLFNIEFRRDALAEFNVFGQNDFWQFKTQGVESIRNAAIELLGFYAACKKRGWQ